MSIISHDLRAPLVNIHGYLELLNSNEVNEEQRPRFEQELLAATNNTMEMLGNLLHWSKSQMEGPLVNLQVLNLLDAIKSTLEMGKMQAQRKGIVLSYQIDPNFWVAADINMLQMVVRNLVSNAIKFTPTGGAISVDACLDGGEYRVTIMDNGQGIDHDKQANIFSLHSQPAYGTNNEKGVGLGLLLCKEYIEHQGGRITFESATGTGSSFYIFVPVAKMDQMA
ncbi:sensor histidine kinase [Mucilaginibacter antarcticus]